MQLQSELSQFHIYVDVTLEMRKDFILISYIHTLLILYITLDNNFIFNIIAF